MVRVTTPEIAILARGEDDNTRHQFAEKLGRVRAELAELFPKSHDFSLLRLSLRAPVAFAFPSGSHFLTIANTFGSDDVYLDVVLATITPEGLALQPCACMECEP